MSRYFATADVWIGDCAPAEDEDIRQRIEDALADYQATVTVTINAYPENAP